MHHPVPQGYEEYMKEHDPELMSEHLDDFFQSLQGKDAKEIMEVFGKKQQEFVAFSDMIISAPGEFREKYIQLEKLFDVMAEVFRPLTEVMDQSLKLYDFEMKSIDPDLLSYSFPIYRKFLLTLPEESQKQWAEQKKNSYALYLDRLKAMNKEMGQEVRALTNKKMYFVEQKDRKEEAASLEELEHMITTL